MKRLIRTLMPAILICLLAPAAIVLAQDNQPKSASAQSDAKKTFAKLKTLTGSWQGTVMNITINFTIRAASSGTAILHEANTTGGGPPQPGDHDVLCGSGSFARDSLL